MNRAKDSDISGVHLPTMLAHLVQKAMDLGWRATRAETGGSLILTAAHHVGPPQTIIIPLGEKTVNQNVLRTWREKIERYQSPTTKAKADTTETPVTVAIPEPTPEPEPEPEPEPAPEPAPGKFVCEECDPPTHWPNAIALGSHSKAHRNAVTPNQRRIAALESIIVTAQNVLGGPRDSDEVRTLREDLKAAVNAQRAAEAQRDKAQAELGELRAALDLFRSAIG